MNRLFVVEGPDRSGKTTLLTQLQKDFPSFGKTDMPRPGEGWEVTEEWDQGKDDFKFMMDHLLRISERHLFIDRFSHSELVYCHAFNRPCDFSWYRQNLIRYRNQIRLIIVGIDRSILTERWMAENMPLDKIAEIVKWYRFLPSYLGLKQEEYFIANEDNYESLKEWIRENSI